MNFRKDVHHRGWKKYTWLCVKFGWKHGMNFVTPGRSVHAMYIQKSNGVRNIIYEELTQGCPRRRIALQSLSGLVWMKNLFVEDGLYRLRPHKSHCFGSPKKWLWHSLDMCDKCDKVSDNVTSVQETPKCHFRDVPKNCYGIIWMHDKCVMWLVYITFQNVIVEKVILKRS